MADTANKIFLLTEEERIFLIPFKNVMDLIIAANVPQDKQDSEFRRMCKEYKLDINRAKKLAKRIGNNNKWFCVFPVAPFQNGDWTGRDKTRPIMQFAYYSSDNPTPDNAQDLAPVEDYTDFYAAIQEGFNTSTTWDETEYYKHQRAALGLDDSYLFVDDDSAMVLLSVFDAFQPIKRPGTLAAEQGAIMTLNNRLTFPSAKGYEKAFTSDIIKEIKPLPGNEPSAEIDPETGKLIAYSEKSFAEVVALDSGFLAAIMSCAYDADMSTQTLKIYVPMLCEELGIDPRPYSTQRKADKDKEESESEEMTMAKRRYEIIYKGHIAAFEKFAGLIDGTWYRLMALSSYDEKSEVISLHAPYMINLAQKLTSMARAVNHSQVNRLFHSNAANEQNKAAVELASLIGAKILQLGEGGSHRKKDEVKYDAYYSTLIQECPQLRKALSDIDQSRAANKAQKYNSKLKQTFEAAFKIILEKSYFPKKFKNFKINGIGKWSEAGKDKDGRRKVARFGIPTRTMISKTKLIITHEGINKDFSDTDLD